MPEWEQGKLGINPQRLPSSENPKVSRAMMKVRKDRAGWERLTSHLEVQSCILITFRISTVFIFIHCKENMSFILSFINLPSPALCVGSLNVHNNFLFKANRKHLWGTTWWVRKEKASVPVFLSYWMPKEVPLPSHRFQPNFQPGFQKPGESLLGSTTQVIFHNQEEPWVWM